MLVTAPKLLLLDEPYSNLDTQHKTLLKEVLQTVSEELQLSCILVSHDQMDTLPWAHKILVLQDGRLVQEAAPQTIYIHPVNEYVASLFGKYNSVTPELLKLFPTLKNSKFIRPEQIHIANSGVEAIVVHSSFMGSHYGLTLTIGTQQLTAYHPHPLPHNCEVFITINPISA
ncbi:MAG: hypothetical protein C4329_06440 [Chitinophagaceae bacterium]